VAKKVSAAEPPAIRLVDADDDRGGLRLTVRRPGKRPESILITVAEEQLEVLEDAVARLRGRYELKRELGGRA
jgi:hypothetical protein